MMRRLAVGLILLAVPADAVANGRPPQILSLHLQPGNPDDVLAAATFGLLASTDRGATWRWTCETAIGYGGTYDPDYAVSPTGAVFATTFDGLKVRRPGLCAWDLSAFGETFAANVAVASDATVYVAISTPGNPTTVPPLPADYKFYRSIDDGVSFDAGTVIDPGGGEWWQSLEPAPSAPQTVYLTGYRIEPGPLKRLLMFRSTTGGQSWSPLPVSGFTITERSDLEIVAVHPTDPDRVLLRVTNWTDVIGDDFWLTIDGGQTWSNVLRLGNYGSGLFRASGDAVIATPGSGVYRSVDGGQSFSPVGVEADHPDVYCLRETAAGELLACTTNYAPAPFDAAVMTTTDLATWTPVAKFQTGILGPLDCPVGTIQRDCCTEHTPACSIMNTPTWCLLAAQLGIVDGSCTVPDAGPIVEAPKTCCGAGDPTGTGLVILVVAVGLTRRRARGAA